jgi:hypothetical protein
MSEIVPHGTGVTDTPFRSSSVCSGQGRILEESRRAWAREEAVPARALPAWRRQTAWPSLAPAPPAETIERVHGPPAPTVPVAVGCSCVGRRLSSTGCAHARRNDSPQLATTRTYRARDTNQIETCTSTRRGARPVKVALLYGLACAFGRHGTYVAAQQQARLLPWRLSASA